eukprot:TRINITY_DN60802_c0_g1_i2.p1 TRINITY_DN60802_c0_g1~~TRINITY_DN60802_c0_g1_i2.p1  ORF type:complete len:104 (-),score=14.83 TRINITY_DN60802_c0_g1_i2:14-325(-)
MIQEAAPSLVRWINRCRRTLDDSVPHLTLPEIEWQQEKHSQPAYGQPHWEAVGKAVSYTHLRAHETPEHLVCRLLLEKKKKKHNQIPLRRYTFNLLLLKLPTR